ncbi:MAG: Lrp/AsnC family transcriptional regulator [Promethearchaeati archaeon]
MSETYCYIFIKGTAGFVEDIVLRLREMEEVEEANVVTGTIDVIAKIKGKDMQTITKSILSEIHRIDGVERTSTHFVVPL